MPSDIAPKSALVADDHPVIRAGVAILLEAFGVGDVLQASDGLTSLRFHRECSPGLVIMDLLMPNLDGMEVISRMIRRDPSTKIIVFSAQESSYFSIRCACAGAAGYVSKSQSLKELESAVLSVCSGVSYFPSSSNRPLSGVPVGDFSGVVSSLSNREVMVATQLAKGATNKEIAKRMILSEKTISTYKTRLMKKLKVRTIAELIDAVKVLGL
ncbi:response regulator transcription factor [Microbulbifer pacificus]|uniref:response regulator transcription factor n=1 Tax=Microbulbifer pacificus TaxID=407164 RepID=UPI000CF41873|nr:response regulator transcription factor [Microbulbifer pacificus]